MASIDRADRSIASSLESRVAVLPSIMPSFEIPPDEATPFPHSRPTPQVSSLPEKPRGQPVAVEPAAEEPYRRLIQYLRAGVVVHAPNTEILLANEQATRLLGLPSEQLPGKKATDPTWNFIREDTTLMPPDEYPVNRVLATRQPVNQVLGINRPSIGDCVWVLIDAFPEFDGQGNLHQIVVTFIDITERKHYEESLKLSEARYSAIIEGLTDLVCRFLPDGTLTFVNDAYCRYFGRSREEIIASNFIPLIPSEDQIFVTEQIARCNIERPINSYEHRVLRGDGQLRWMQWSDQAIFDDYGTLIELQSVGRDITDRKNAEAALRASEVRFRQLFNRMSTGFALHEIIVDDQGQPQDYRFLEVNPAFEQITGLSAERLVGQTVRQVLPDTEVDWIEIYGQVALTGRPIQFENHAQMLGKTFEVIAYSPQRGQFACLFTDITGRKRMEAALRELATTDDLTGLANRRHFMACLDEELARLRRNDTQRAMVLMLDLDHFKRINDTFGHAAGDAVLRHCTGLMRDALRKIDKVGRLGGEEFAILLSGADRVAAQNFAERLRQKIMTAPVTHNDRVIPITVSIGIAALKPQDASVDAVLGRADAALYRAKASGRNKVIWVVEEG